MWKELYLDEEHTRDNGEVTESRSDGVGGLPHRLMTAFEVAEYIGCHEETVRRAYLRIPRIVITWSRPS